MNGERPMLNWDEVKEMHDGGVLFGAHTCTHPILSRMPLEEARLEIAESKRMIEEQLGLPVKHFAFPNGRNVDFSEELRSFCKQIGFETIATCNDGVNDETVSPYALKRMGVEGPLSVFAVQIAKAFLFRR
jgi:peptidoglycan/xylan/chitin deacetylase (PgdA/CDA1 family)